MKSEKLINAIGKIDDDYIEEARNPKMKKKVNVFEIVGKLATVVCAFFLVVMTFNVFATKGSSMDTASYDYQAAEEELYESDFAVAGVDGMSKVTTANGSYEMDSSLETRESKIIVNGDMNMECKDLDEVLESLNSIISEYKGYVQSAEISNGYYRHYSATIRIPAESYSEFIEKLNGVGKSTYYSESTDDVTDSYYDILGRLENYKAEEERIQELYKKAETLTEILEIEDKLTEIRYEIDYYENKIKNYDLLTEYSTLTIDIEETVEYETKTLSFFERIEQAFVTGLADVVQTIGDFVIGVFYYWWAILLIVIGFIVYRIIKKKKAKKNS